MSDHQPGRSERAGTSARQETPPPAPAAAAALATQDVTVTGLNQCLGCALKKAAGAPAQCSVHGHRHALVVESAAANDGRPLPGLAGRTLHYLENDRSAALVAGKALH